VNQKDASTARISTGKHKVNTGTKKKKTLYRQIPTASRLGAESPESPTHWTVGSGGRDLDGIGLTNPADFVRIIVVTASLTLDLANAYVTMGLSLTSSSKFVLVHCRSLAMSLQVQALTQAVANNTNLLKDTTHTPAISAYHNVLGDIRLRQTSIG
jgi:hypothetical protein